MISNKLIAAAATTGALLMSPMAHATLSITLNPCADGVATCPSTITPTQQFSAQGLQSNLYSTLVINSNSGTTGFTESGTIAVTSFNSGGTTVANTGITGLDSTSSWLMNGTFNISGSGTWSGIQYNASTTGLNFTLDLTAVNQLTHATINLGTATWNASQPTIGFAIAFGSLSAGSSGTGFTSLTASMNFAPAAGTSGFFVAPSPFDIMLAFGNAGGNTLNTSYSVDSTGKVTVVVPGTGATNAGTANVSFAAPVPEPGALSLAGIALVGLAFAGRRKARKSA
ncbi:MAG: flocculation-associated PEP-CTERM protein PepA [Burkholderiales bacterium]|nr:flocculation-associated PEP-CTERM protein PepA [Burkholderiales bacterium]